MSAPSTPRRAVYDSDGVAIAGSIVVDMELAAAIRHWVSVELRWMSGTTTSLNVPNDITLIELKDLIPTYERCNVNLLQGGVIYNKPIDKPFQNMTNTMFDAFFVPDDDTWKIIIHFKFNGHSVILNKDDDLYQMQTALLKPFNAQPTRYQADLIVNGTRYDKFHEKPFENHEKIDDVHIELAHLTDLRIFTPSAYDRPRRRPGNL